MIVGAFVLPRVIVGITEASTTRRPSMPRTRSSGSTTERRRRAHPAGADRVVEQLDPPAEVGGEGLVVVGRRTGVDLPAGRSPPAGRWRRSRGPSFMPATIAAMSASSVRWLPTIVGLAVGSALVRLSSPRARGATSTGPIVIRVPVVLLEPVIGEVGGGEVELEVGRPVAAVGAGEEERPRRPVDVSGPRRRSRKSTRAAGFSASASEPPIGDVPDPDHGRVVLEVRADGRERRPSASIPIARELLGVADPGEHQQLRRADRAGREDHLAAGPRDRHRGLPRELDAAHPAVGELEPERRRGGQDRQVRPPGGGPQEGVGGAPAPTVLLRRLDDADAVGLAVVVVGVEREAALPAASTIRSVSARGLRGGATLSSAADAVASATAPASWCSERMK